MSIPLSVQLYTIRDAMNADLAGALKKVAQIGYRNVEPAGFAGKTAAEMRTLLADCGLSAPSAHVGLEALQGEGLAKIVDDYGSLGCRKLVVPFLGGEWRQGGQGYAHTAEVLNEIGARLHSQGFELGYHNHAFEFEDKVDGKAGLELLIENTAPELVTFEVDTYWVLYAGVDPVKFVETHASRIGMLHIKDMDGSDRSFAPVGTGILPLDGLLEAAKRAPSIKYLIVEQDSATKQTPMEAIEISYRTMQSKGYA